MWVMFGLVPKVFDEFRMRLPFTYHSALHWANHLASIDGPVDFTILLDTRFTQWSAEWYVNNQLIRNSSNTFGTNPNITHIGFSAYQDATGSMEFFQFGTVDAALPEPGTAAFSILGFFLIRGLRSKQEEYC